MYPKIEHARLFKNTVNRGLLNPLPAGLLLVTDSNSPYLVGEIMGRRYTLGMSENGWLVGFDTIKAGTEAAFACVKTGYAAFKVFYRVHHTPEMIEAFLETEELPEISAEEIARLPVLRPAGEKQWAVLPPVHPAKTIAGGFKLNY